MKVSLLAFVVFVSFSINASDLRIKDYHWQMSDITTRGLTKEYLFSRMDRKFIKVGKSICSNRALMWAKNFKRGYNLDTGKIFLFYTKKRGNISLKTWWYHVAPVVNENGTVAVMDAGFPGWIDRPLTIHEWLYQFSKSKNCKEINAHEVDLIEYIFNGRVFPNQTAYGYHDCYWKIVPHTIWTPEIMAMNLLGKDSTGRPVRVERPDINRDELMQACMEATVGKLGWILRDGKKYCEGYVQW